MNRTGVRFTAALLAVTATFSVLGGVAKLAELESSYGLPVVVLPRVVVTAPPPAPLADCNAVASPEDAYSGSVAQARAQFKPMVYRSGRIRSRNSRLAG